LKNGKKRILINVGELKDRSYRNSHAVPTKSKSLGNS